MQCCAVVRPLYSFCFMDLFWTYYHRFIQLRYRRHSTLKSAGLWRVEVVWPSACSDNQSRSITSVQLSLGEMSLFGISGIATMSRQVTYIPIWTLVFAKIICFLNVELQADMEHSFRKHILCVTRVVFHKMWRTYLCLDGIRQGCLNNNDVLWKCHSSFSVAQQKSSLKFNFNELQNYKSNSFHEAQWRSLIFCSFWTE